MLRWVSASLVAALALVACGGGSGPPPPGGSSRETITFRAPRGAGARGTVTLVGHVWGKSERAVVFAHMFPGNEGTWGVFARDISSDGVMAMTFAFRGYRPSGGKKEIDRIDLDLEAAVAEVRRRGAKTVALAGASMGGTAALKIAARDDVACVVSLSGADEFRGLDARADTARVTEPVLLVAAQNDREALASLRDLEKRITGDLRTELIEGSAAHGTDLLEDGTVGAAVRSLIRTYLLECLGVT